MNTEALFLYVSSTPLTWLIVTIGAYKIGMFIYEKTGKRPLFQPIIIALLLILPVLVHSDIPYQTYFSSLNFLHFFLGPATVALALPLYKNLKHIQAYFVPILITLVAGGVFAIISAVFILWVLGASHTTMLSMSTKSITAPIGIIIAQDIGAVVSLSIAFITFTGLLSVLFRNSAFKLFRIKSDAAKGFALGLIAHALGTSSAVEISEKAAAFGALAMGFSGVLMAILLPLAVHFL
ncbi:LrgB family protein [Sulfurospirillum barnesii]|uniref:Putative effector of murein hydrolase n=1 Tax=Sulfurospirillum barnesii (strain ATCC 700032 / DSM 10660 / SES-3) TaxID=760154 RepID=I3XVW2_SULBS|nr:LrgB family protein [Sulfurospirillum barnesii]AFL68086.1 putative effector of murein hydrolase [Sulfurospirillum barnesii SES-3]